MPKPSNNAFDEFTESLALKLQNPLPGDLAHTRMAAQSRLRMTVKPNEHTRRSAVLILFFPYQSEVYLPLILRPAYDGVHSGQMAFPGGRYERTDENLIRTALREAQEEIGLRLTDVKVLGQLTELFIPPSNFYVQPVVACIPYRPEFYPDPREVERVLVVNLREMTDKSIIGESEIQVRGVTIQAPHYLVQNHKVWGATAMMISELIAVIES